MIKWTAKSQQVRVDGEKRSQFANTKKISLRIYQNTQLTLY